MNEVASAYINIYLVLIENKQRFIDLTEGFPPYSSDRCIVVMNLILCSFEQSMDTWTRTDLVLERTDHSHYSIYSSHVYVINIDTQA